MIYALKGCITNKLGSGMCGDTPLLINFVYEIDLSVAYLIYSCILLFVCLFIWVLWIFVLNRKELNVFEACVGTLSSLQENSKTDKKIYTFCVNVLLFTEYQT